MTDRPIIFSGPMVRALIDGRKTQTRRVVSPQPFLDAMGNLCTRTKRDHVVNWGQHMDGRPYTRHFADRHVRFAIGDRLWVRETWTARMTHGWTIADARSRMFQQDILYAADDVKSIDGWWPSIFLPREFSRLTLTVTDVRVERLQDITEADAIAEGATSRPDCSGCLGRYPGWSMDWSRVGQGSRFARDGKVLSERDVSLGDARMAFANFINGLHDPRWNHKGDGIFGANPWVAVLSFTVHHQNIDALGAQEAT